MTVAELHVLLEARNQEFKKALDEAEKRLKRVEETGDKAAKKISDSWTRAGKTMKEIGGVFTATFTAAGAAIAGLAVKGAADFQRTGNILQQVSRASEAEMERVRAKAVELGKDLTLPATSANDAMLAMTELSKAGLNVAETMDAAKGVLQLSAIAQVGNAEAAEIAANALNAFSLKGKDATRVADMLAAAADSSSASVVELAQGFQMGATLASAAGLQIEEFTSWLALMANAGIKGSDAGTSIKSALTQLLSPGKEAAKTFQMLGERVAGLATGMKTAEGGIKPLKQLLGELEQATRGLGEGDRIDILSSIFGTDGVRAALVLLKAGTEGFEDMGAMVKRVGYGAEATEAQTKGLWGAIDGLKSTIETLLVKEGTAFLGFFESAVRWMTQTIEWAESLDGGTKRMLSTFAGALVVGGPILLLMSQLITSFQALIGLRATMLAALGAQSLAIAGVGTAAAAATGQIGLLQKALIALVGGKWVVPVTVAISTAWLGSQQMQRGSEAAAGRLAKRMQDAQAAAGLDLLAMAKQRGLNGKQLEDLRQKVTADQVKLLPQGLQQLIQVGKLADAQIKQVEQEQKKRGEEIERLMREHLSGKGGKGGGKGAKAGRSGGGSEVLDDLNATLIGGAVGAAAQAASQMAEASYRAFQSTMARIKTEIATLQDPVNNRMAQWAGMDLSEWKGVSPEFRKKIIEARMQLALVRGELGRLAAAASNQALAWIFGGASGPPRGLGGVNAEVVEAYARSFGGLSLMILQAAQRSREFSQAIEAQSRALEADRLLEEWRVYQDQLYQARDLASQVSDALLQGFERVREEGLGGLLRSFEDTLWQMGQAALHAELTRILTGLFAPSPSDTGIGQAVLKGVGLFGGFRAEGGPVTAGVPYVVGERGPEMFVPERSGQIVPNGGAVTVHVHVHGVKDEGSLKRTAGQVARQAAAAVESARRRG